MSESAFTNELGKVILVTLCRLLDNSQERDCVTIEMKWKDTIHDIRNCISQRTGIPNKQICILDKGRKLVKSISLYQLNVENNQINLHYYIRSSERGESWLRVISNRGLDEDFLSAVDDVRNGFSVGINPELSLYGTGGTYFLNDRYRWNLLVFKPEDEEPFAENNPRMNNER